jgi:hypothetical protein
MQQPPNLTLDALLNPQQLNESLDAVGMTAAEKQATLVLSHLVYSRDLCQLQRASVVLLLDVSKVQSYDELVPSGAFAHGEHALRWLNKKVRALSPLHTSRVVQPHLSCTLRTTWQLLH